MATGRSAADGEELQAELQMATTFNTFTLDEILHHRRLSSAVLSDWKERMVFYTGDERNFYQGASSLACDPSEAAFDPSCRSPRKTHREVAYAGTGGYPDGYGVYRDGCTFMAAWNAWSCTNSSLTPARLVIESMDADHKSRWRRAATSTS